MIFVLWMFFVFFFKQKTAYEMRISDWSSDVCSSDLSYLRFTDSEDCALIAIIENFCIEVTERAERRHIIEALPLGIITDGKFIRGGDTLTIPPTGVAPATEADIKKIFEDSVEPKLDRKSTSLNSSH